MRAKMFNSSGEKVMVIDSPDIGAVEQLIRQSVALKVQPWSHRR